MEDTKLVQEFGVKPIDQALINRLEQITKKPAHRFLRRGIFSGHRNLEQILDLAEKGEPFYLYTGRGPSSGSLHLGHLVALEFTQYLQEVFQVPLVIQLTDDEKYLRNQERSLAEITQFTDENLKDLIALGFDPTKTFIFRDTEYIGTMYPVILQLQRNCTISELRATFGIADSDKAGNICFPLNQAAPAISASFPALFDPTRKLQCLIPCALDQDVYFRITRDICQRIKTPKPSLVLSGFLPDLRGPRAQELNREQAEATGKSLAELSKMSSTSKVDVNPAVIFLDATPKKVAKIVKQHAFSGGRETLEEHRALGGNPDVDMSFKYLEFFYEDDDHLAQLKADYRSGKLLTGELKQILITTLQNRLQQFQLARAAITDELIQQFTTPRKLI